MFHFLKIALIAVIVLVAPACKKGEDDPLISLRTRKARLVGEWTVTSGTSFSSYDNKTSKDAYTNTYTKDAYSQVQKYTSPQGSFEAVTEGFFAYTIKFEKNGAFTSTQTINKYTTIIYGTWNFTSNIGEKKNKEELIINVKSTLRPVSLMSSTYTGNKTSFTYRIHELRNKRLVVSSESNETTNNWEYLLSDKYSFEQ